MDILYHILVGAAILIVSPFVAVKMIFSASFREDILRRLQGAGAIDSVSECVWIHAASVGEVRAALILIKALKERKTFPSIVL
ncbi:MAG: glycosyltransferase N-terminal domain-containing protein, partial [Nitrospinales bacterium]